MKHSSIPPGRLGAWIAALALTLAGCGSTGGGYESSGEARSIAVRLVGYGNQTFALVSETHTSRVDLYSTERVDAGTKVQNDEVMDALVERLHELGFGDHAKPGTAPEQGGSMKGYVFEVRDEGVSSWWVLDAGSGDGEMEDFGTAVREFISLYNVTHGFQAVKNNEGGAYFDRRKIEGR